MNKISNAKKLLLSLGLGLGIGLSNAAVGSNCSYLLQKCEGFDTNWHLYCIQYQNQCGDIP